jgi:putative ABC transport system permease protein
MDNVIVVPMKDDLVRSKFTAIRSILLSNGDILKVAGTSSIPGGQFNQNSIRQNEDDDNIDVYENFVTADFFSLLKIETAEGRVFSDHFRGDSASSFVLNEAAARLFNWSNPVDQTITYYGDILTNARGRIIGVVRDFNIHSLHHHAEPLILILAEDRLLTYMLVKISPENRNASLAFIEKTWKQFDNRHTFTYSFLKEDFENQYEGETRMGSIFWIFAVLAIVIAALGLFGLSNFMIEQRTKEIGIRKVHGADVVTIVWIFIKQFSSWVLIASAVAIPIGAYFSKYWLKNFAYRTPIGIIIFVCAIMIAIGITILTIGYQSLRTAQKNPVDSLQYE